MLRQLRLDWNSLLEFAPHLLCIATLATGKGVLAEEAIRNPPAWARVTFVVAALALMPVCYMAGKSVLRWPRRWMVASLTWVNGTMAVLAGVCVGLLGVAVFFEAAVRFTGIATFDAFWRSAAIGGTLGLLAFLTGWLRRRQRLMRA